MDNGNSFWGAKIIMVDDLRRRSPLLHTHRVLYMRIEPLTNRYRTAGTLCSRSTVYLPVVNSSAFLRVTIIMAQDRNVFLTRMEY